MSFPPPPGQPQPGYPQSGQPQPGYQQSGYPQSGYPTPPSGYPTPPSGYPTPPPGYPTPYPPSQSGTPGSVTAARVICWIQGGLTVVLGVILLILAATFNSATDGSRFADFGDVAAGFFVIFGILVFLGAASVMVPTALLKPGRKAPPIVLIVFQGLYIVFDLISVVGELNNSGNPILILLAMASSIAVIILLLRPSARAWSAGQTAAYPAYGQYAPGQMAGYPQQVLPPPTPPAYPQSYAGPGYGTSPYEQSANQPQPYQEHAYTDQPAQPPYGQSGPYNQPPS